MNNKVSVRQCEDYDFRKIYDYIRDIYAVTGGPDVKGKKVLLKPNILSDVDPEKSVSTHPVVLEAMIRFMQSEGATVCVGDSPAVHRKGFRPDKSGISMICESTGVKWIDFLSDPAEKKAGRRKVRIASIVNDVDLIISLPKLKTHELMYFSGAVKNTLGLVPGFSKAMQHGYNRDRNGFGEFLVDLTEAVTPDYFFMDGIMGMEGPGPGIKGIPVATGVLLGSTNPLALDITASRIAGYNPVVIPTSRIAIFRKKWLSGIDDIIYDGPELSTITKNNFKRIPNSANSTAGLRFILGRTVLGRRMERRPVFIHNACTGCRKCVDICPAEALSQHPGNRKHIILNDKKCIRCFCCAEVCLDSAIEIKVRFFGD